MSQHEAKQTLRLIQSNDLFIQGLYINPSYYFVLRQLGSALGQNTIITKLTLDWPSSDLISVQDIESFCRGLSNNRSIKSVVFLNGSLSHLSKGNALQWMGFFALSNQSLEFASFDDYDYNDEIDSDDEDYDSDHFEVVRYILRAGTSLKKVELDDRWDEHETELFALVGHLPNLEELSYRTWIEMCDPLTGITGLANLIQNQQSNLTIIRLHFLPVVADKVFEAIMPSLERNTKLVCLELNVDGSLNDIKSIKWDPLERVLMLHNHTLERVFPQSLRSLEVHGEINSLLQMNSSADKTFVRIRKSLDYDFLIPERGINCEPLDNEFEIPHLPYLLASIGAKRSSKDHRSENFRFNALYHFVKNKPLLVVDSGGQKNAEKKRKRE